MFATKKTILLRPSIFAIYKLGAELATQSSSIVGYMSSTAQIRFHQILKALLLHQMMCWDFFMKSISVPQIPPSVTSRDFSDAQSTQWPFPASALLNQRHPHSGIAQAAAAAQP